jgi:hypothetical protein
MESTKTAIEDSVLHEVHNSVTTRISYNKKIKGINKSIRHKKLKGLCGNCDFADTCIYDKPVTGIWHCNEYQ